METPRLIADALACEPEIDKIALELAQARDVLYLGRGVHYPIALWLQYWLFDYNLPAIVKATVGFVLTVAFSWALTRALRQIPGASKVL